MNPTKPGDDPSVYASGSGCEPPADASASEGSLAKTLEEFLGLAKSGVRPSREEFLARHPDRADALAECLDGLEFILSAVPELVGETGETTGEIEGGLEAPSAIMPSTLLGDYRIVREVGRGGMGVVFEAQQLSLGRKVALKVLPFAASLDPRQRQRFQLEAQAAAHLHHPHIVPVFAVGRDRGIHYYAMQFIDGRTLSSIVREIRRASADPSATGTTGPRAEILHAARTPSAEGQEPESPSGGPDAPTKPSGSGAGRREADYFRAVARIGKQAALALDHAHGLGVIHRDVKPGNLMLDAEGDLWVTDFGLARFLDEPGVTRTGDLLGTLAYMSPEQALGRREADHRGDIYSLGATLYELLTLRPPFEGRDRQELLRKIAHEEPVHPRRVDPAVPLDLETIVLKSMEKEASARYPSARELADELERFLSDEPIRARRPGPIEHLAKWSRRHRTAVVTASTVLMLAMTVGTVLMIGERQRTEQARQDLRQSFLKMVQVADVVTLEAMGLASVTSMDEKTSSARKAESQRIFSKAHDFYEMAAAQPQSDDEMRALVAHATHRLAFTKMLTGRNGGEETFALSVARYEDLIARAGKSSYGLSLRSIFGQRPARERTPVAIERDAKDGPLVVNVSVPSKEYLLALADTLNDWAMLTGGARNPEKAGPLYERAMAIRRDVAMKYPVEPSEVLLLVENETRWAAELDAMKKAREAADKRTELLAFARSLSTRLADETLYKMQLAEILTRKGKDLIDFDRRREAESFFRFALELAPGNELATNNLAWVLVTRPGTDLFDPAFAVALAKQAIQSRPNVYELWNTLGVAHYRAGDRKEAETALRKSMELGAGGTPNDWLFLAMSRWEEGSKAEAKELYDRSTAWMARNPKLALDPDLQSFVREAAAKLCVPEPPAPAEPKRRAEKPPVVDRSEWIKEPVSPRASAGRSGP